MRTSHVASLLASILSLFMFGCPDEETVKAPESPSTVAVASSAKSDNAPATNDNQTAASITEENLDPRETVVAQGGKDPLAGQFTLAEATEGLPGSGTLVAAIHTTEGDLRCTLDAVNAPMTVANFVGLARGKRPYKKSDGTWVKKPAYDGLTFHRIIKGFMVQGGDPEGVGTGEPGYVIADENANGKHDRPGLLCMANRGHNTNGMQFFITDAAPTFLDGRDTTYTIFGECSPVEVVHAIASVPTGVADRPTRDVRMTAIRIRRAN